MGYSSSTLEDNMIELKMVSRQMVRSTKKCEQKEKQALAKLKKVRVSGSPSPSIVYSRA